MAFPSPLVMLSVLAVAMASITFVATRDQAPTERRVDNTATIASADQTPRTKPTTTAPTRTPKPEPQVKRGEVYVEVFNNSGIKGLAATTAARATQVGWAAAPQGRRQAARPRPRHHAHLSRSGRDEARPSDDHPHHRRPAVTR